MPSFTMPLWEVMKLRQDPGWEDPWVAGAGSKIGLDRYEIFDESHRDVLNQKICAEFYLREMGQETVDQFVFMLERRMRKIMPYWNQIYQSELIKYDPLATYNLQTIRNDKTTEDVKRDSTGGTTTTNDTRGTGIATDTPQSQLPDDWEEDANYASSGSASKTTANITASTNANDTTDSTSEMDGTSTTSGFQGAASDLLARYRAVLLNVDAMVIAQLGDLFMLFRANGDEMLPTPTYNNLYAIGMGY